MTTPHLNDDDAVNRQAGFLPADEPRMGSKPTVRLGDALISAYMDHGTLVVSVNFLDDADALPVRVAVDGSTVWNGPA
jgi:hypothetical protein